MPEAVAFASHDEVVIDVGLPEAAPPDRSTALPQMLAPCSIHVLCVAVHGCHAAWKVWLAIVEVAGVGAMHSLWDMAVVPAARR